MMINRIKTLIIIPLLFLLAYTSNSFAVEDKIIAVVNDELITFRDLQEYIRSTYMELSTRGMPKEKLNQIMDDLQKSGLNKLIEDKLILSKATKMGIEVKKELIDNRVDEIKKKYGSEQIFTKALIDNGATISDLRKKILNQFKIKFIIEYEVKSKIYVKPQDVTDFYKNNPDEFHSKERVSLESIYIAYKDNKDAAIAKAKEAFNKIQNKEIDFKEAEKKYSDAPSIGIVEKGQIMKQIEDVIFNLNINEVSDPVKVDSGVYIFKLIEKIPPHMEKLENVKDKIYSYLYDKEFKEKFEIWLEKLKKDAYIEIK